MKFFLHKNDFQLQNLNYLRAVIISKYHDINLQIKMQKV